jgi:hypothetical protein
MAGWMLNSASAVKSARLSVICEAGARAMEDDDVSDSQHGVSAAELKSSSTPDRVESRSGTLEFHAGAPTTRMLSTATHPPQYEAHHPRRGRADALALWAVAASTVSAR